MADAVSYTLRTRVHLERNGVDVHDQTYRVADVELAERSYQRVALSAAMTNVVEIDLQGIGTASALFLYPNRSIEVGVDSNTMLMPVLADGSLMLTGSFTHLYMVNRAQTYTATVELVAMD